MKTIIELAKSACAPNQTFNSDPEWVERFAALVRAEREWVDLTDDEIAQAVGSPLDEVYIADFRAVITAFKEKQK